MNLDWHSIPSIHARRITLRALTDRDVEAVYRIYSDEEVMRYWGGEAFQQLSDAEDFLAEVRNDLRQRRCLQWAIVESANDELIGTFAFFHWDRVAEKCEIGFALKPAYWGNGYMSEAVQAAIAFAFDHLNIRRVEADVDPRNLACAKLLEKLGFTKEGFLRERWLVKTETQDSLFYGLLKKEWDSLGVDYSVGSNIPLAGGDPTGNRLWSRAKHVAVDLRIFLAALLHL